MINEQLLRMVLLAALVPLGLTVSPGSAAEEAPRLLRVMTYNVRYASDRPPNAWPDRRPVARQMLTQLAPDVIGLQEALYRQVKDLAEDLADYQWIGLGRDGGSRGEFMAVFYRPERLEPLEFDHYWLSDTPDVIGSTTWGNSNRRMVTWVRFRDRLTQAEFYFLNTHFDHEIQAARENSARLVLGRCAALEAGVPVLLVGDFNAAAQNNPVYEMLVGDDRFHDTWNRAQRRGDLFATFHGFAPPRPDGPRIDWILSRGDVTAHDAQIVTFSVDGQYPSDHCPVMADVQIAPPE